jgi:glycolate oxidase
MALPRNVLRILEDIVGPENISDEPVVLDTYAFQYLAETVTGTKFCARPGAVVLPGSTEEVQAIVKTCNRYRVKFKALSTGWGVWNTVGGEGTIQLDLRRMNRILDIDDKNMYAVVEPYVIGAQLQVEAMKRGLNCHIIGAGANFSPLASCTSMVGHGLSGIFMGFSARNPLAVEWVLPTGDILRLGSLGSGAGWFCGDGPGPSLRGIMRGFMGAMGGMGVFTKCAVKLYPWPGPPVLQIEGLTPEYTTSVPDNFRFYALAFPNWDRFADAAYKIAEAEIGYVMGRQLPPGLVPLLLVRSSAEYAQTRQSGMADELMQEFRHAFLLVLAGSSLREIEYQEKALKEILAETEGRIPSLTQDPEIEKTGFSFLVKGDRNGLIFKLAGTFHTSFGAATAWDAAVAGAKTGEELKKKYIEKGVIVDDAADAAWGGLYEQGRFGHLEELFMYDPSDPESAKGAVEYLAEADEAVLQRSLGQPLGALPNQAAGVYGPACFNYQDWMRRIKKAFDPNVASDPSFYIEPEES